MRLEFAPMPESTDTPKNHLKAALAILGPAARYVRVEANDLSAFIGQFDACDEAYTNNTEERDMYEVAYRDLRTVVKDVLNHPSLPPNLETRLRAVFENGEVLPRD